MKNILFVAVLLTTAATAVAGSMKHKASQAEVERAIDSRLHEMLVKLNAEKK